MSEEREDFPETVLPEGSMSGFRFSLADVQLDPGSAAEEVYQAYEEEMAEWENLNQFKPAISLSYLTQRPRVPIKSYCPRLIAAGAITCIAGDPKAGKTTLMLHALTAVVNGQQFLGRQCTPVNVLYATEQTEVSFRAQIDKLPKPENERFRVILFENNKLTKQAPGECRAGDKPNEIELAPANWDEQIELWRKAVKLNNAKILVIDTWTAFGNFKLGESFDPGVVQSRGQALKALIGEVPELAIVLLHHLRKEGQNQTGARSFSDIANSYALRAFTDQNTLIYKPSPNVEDDHKRVLSIEGRLTDNMDPITVELTDEGYKDVTVRLAKKNDNPNKQALIAAAVRSNPALNNLSIRDLKNELKVPKNQVELFRKQWPKGTCPDPL